MGIRQDRNVPEFGVSIDKIRLWISGITFPGTDVRCFPSAILRGTDNTKAVESGRCALLPEAVHSVLNTASRSRPVRLAPR